MLAVVSSSERRSFIQWRKTAPSDEIFLGSMCQGARHWRCASSRSGCDGTGCFGATWRHLRTRAGRKGMPVKRSGTEGCRISSTCHRNVGQCSRSMSPKPATRFQHGGHPARSGAIRPCSASLSPLLFPETADCAVAQPRPSSACEIAAPILSAAFWGRAGRPDRNPRLHVRRQRIFFRIASGTDAIGG